MLAQFTATTADGHRASQGQARDPSRRRRDHQAGPEQGVSRVAESVRVHRRTHRRSRRESAEMGPPAKHLEQRRRNPRIRGDGEGILRTTGLPGIARLRRRHHRVGRPRQPGGLRQVRRRCASDDRHLLAVRHDADYAARCLDVTAVRGASGRAAAVQESDDRPRYQQFEGTGTGVLERADVDQSGDRKATGQHHFRRRGRRRADGHRAAQVHD